MKLFYINGETRGGESLDAFVIANNDKEAVSLWRQADFVQEMGSGEKPLVFIINPAGVFGPARVLGWHTAELIEVEHEA